MSIDKQIYENIDRELAKLRSSLAITVESEQPSSQQLYNSAQLPSATSIEVGASLLNLPAPSLHPLNHGRASSIMPIQPPSLWPEASDFPQNDRDVFFDLKFANDMFKAAKESVKINSEKQLMEKILEAQRNLNTRIPMFFQCVPAISPFNFSFNNQKLLELSASLASLHHDDLGVLLLCLGSIGAATWGRMDIEIEHGWVEKTPSMQIHACESSTGTEVVINSLRKPFEDFKANLENLMPDADTRKADETVKAVVGKHHTQELTQFIKGKEITSELLDELKNLAKTYVTNTRGLTAALNKTPPMLLVDKATPSGLVKILHTQGEACAHISPEGDFLENVLLKTSAEPSFFNKLFNQEPFVGTINRKNIQLKHPAFSMLTLVQHSVLSRFCGNEKLQELGTTARVLPYLHSGKKFFFQNYVLNADAYDWYCQKIRDMLNFYHTQDTSATRYKVTLTPEATNLISAYKQEINRPRFIHEKARLAMSKLCGQAVRLAWGIHACNYDIPHDHPITADEVSLAIDLCRMLQHHIAYVYDPSGFQAYSNAKKVITNLQNINITLGNYELTQGYIDSRVLQQRTHIKSNDILHALQLLQQHGWITMIDNGKRGYIVIPNPRIMNY